MNCTQCAQTGLSQLHALNYAILLRARGCGIAWTKNGPATDRRSDPATKLPRRNRAHAFIRRLEAKQLFQGNERPLAAQQMDVGWSAPRFTGQAAVGFSH